MSTASEPPNPPTPTSRVLHVAPGVTVADVPQKGRGLVLAPTAAALSAGCVVLREVAAAAVPLTADDTHTDDPMSLSARLAAALLDQGGLVACAGLEPRAGAQFTAHRMRVRRGQELRRCRRLVQRGTGGASGADSRCDRGVASAPAPSPSPATSAELDDEDLPFDGFQLHSA